MINDIMTFLNQNSGALTVIFAAVVAISTIVYARLTSALVSETKKMREVQTEPRIEVTLKPFEFAVNIVRLHIKNIGFGPAENLKFKTSVISGGETAQALLNEFTQTNFFTTGLKYFGPSQEVYSHYTQMNRDYDKKIESVLLFEMEYESITGKKYTDKTIIDMSEMKGFYQLGTPSLHSIAKSLENIQKNIANITSGFKRIKTDIYTQADRECEHEELKQRYNKAKSDDINS